jgi:hypothetical protein
VTGLLHVGSPTVRQSVFGDWLVDDGSLVLQHAADRRAAYADAAARTDVPPTGDPSTLPGWQIATTGRAGSAPTAPVPPTCGGRAPESPDASSRASGSGAIKAFRGCEGAGAATAVEVAAPALADHIENGAAA